ncbi:hypothetical protein [Sutterella sp.]|uniref:hypothetical protein n=1 Tax=Sutterella sp. TaxID=1981025 RepID=UPI0026DEDC6D|nr:hypothetical protein [Sutterella sp.]MDO5532574.1 hypothetical protein [Sutterella sp.]
MLKSLRSSGPAGLASLAIFAGAFALAIFLLAGPVDALAQTVAIDPNFGTPPPPNDAFPQDPEHVFIGTSCMVVLALVFCAIAFHDAWKWKTTVPIGLVLGAAFCVVPEVIDNYLGGVYWSQSHGPDQILYVLLGREFDYYVSLMWWAFGACLGYILYGMLLRRVKTRTLWLGMALSMLADIIIEELLLNYGGIYCYYGNQPMILISKFPMWWMFANVSALFISVAIAYKYRHWLNGWRCIFMFFLMPFCYIGGWELAGMPVVFAINGNFSPLVTQALGIATAVISLVQIAGTMHIVLGRNPLDAGIPEAESESMAVAQAARERL